MAERIEDIMPRVWNALEKAGLDDLQIYRTWQIITDQLAEAGWLRKRPGKPHRIARPLQGVKLSTEEDNWADLVLGEYGYKRNKPEKKDHISTSELIDEEAKQGRVKAVSTYVPDNDTKEEPPVHVQRKRREGQW